MSIAQQAPGRRRQHGGGRSLVPYLYVLPATVLLVVFVALPLAQTVFYSFNDWDGLTAPEWVGLENYTRAIGDPDVRAAVAHALLLMLFYSVLPVSLGLVMAALLSRRRLPGMPFFRTVLFLPQIITLVVSGVAWRWMYADDGVVNQLLRAVGLDGVTRAWLGDFTFALPAVGLVGIWVVFGFCIVLFVAGIAGIDETLYDAARVDGAGPVREFFNVTVPALRPQIAIALTVTAIGGLRSFDVVYVTTGGGPGRATQVPALLIYQLAFVEGRVGLAAAVAVVLTAVIVAVAVAARRLVSTEEA
ncbi:carbohydrate ABC transporter permease [Nocardioides bruguierae]|uniref:carbohydrate ABC transporter permease n=1 Tax=Nocardioides bruguierae TaxID=2945102 RepID=UPI00202091B3|nr:sugar ABC transporter permease [Nocardioides bruguierae]MCL8024473.1 sugar ABC transporter permease [Nocardioides bruguierae]